MRLLWQALSANKKREQLLADQPAMSVTAIFQILEATPIFSVYWGPVERDKGHARFSTGNRWWQWEATLVCDAGGTQPRCFSSGDSGAPIAQLEHEPCQPLPSDSWSQRQ